MRKPRDNAKNPCVDCKWYDWDSPWPEYCNCGKWVPDPVYGKRWDFKFPGSIEEAREKCGGKYFEPSLKRRILSALVCATSIFRTAIGALCRIWR